MFNINRKLFQFVDDLAMMDPCADQYVGSLRRSKDFHRTHDIDRLALEGVEIVENLKNQRPKLGAEELSDSFNSSLVPAKLINGH